MIAQFALRLICGMSLMWCIMPRSQVTAGFFRIQMLVALGLSVLSALTVGQLEGTAETENGLLSQQSRIVMSAVLGVFAFLGSVVWTLNRRRAGAVFVYLIAGVSIGMLLQSAFDAADVGALSRLFIVLSEITAAAMLGAATTGMLLGHWYLTAPTMSIAPLHRLNDYFAVAVSLRFVLSAIGLFLVWGQLSESTHLYWLVLRWTAGIVGPMFVVVMVRRILKYKNTQAATGVLFAGVILTFIGEMTAGLLYRELLTPM